VNSLAVASHRGARGRSPTDARRAGRVTLVRLGEGGGPEPTSRSERPGRRRRRRTRRDRTTGRRPRLSTPEAAQASDQAPPAGQRPSSAADRTPAEDPPRRRRRRGKLLPRCARPASARASTSSHRSRHQNDTHRRTPVREAGTQRHRGLLLCPTHPPAPSPACCGGLLGVQARRADRVAARSGLDTDPNGQRSQVRGEGGGHPRVSTTASRLGGRLELSGEPWPAPGPRRALTRRASAPATTPERRPPRPACPPHRPAGLADGR
jgi:hypothetical protein